MKYDIIIPHYTVGDTERLALRCLSTIRQHTKDYRLIWIDNSGQVAPTILEELSQHAIVTVIRNSENLGFVKAVNQGLSISTAPNIVLMNNDTEAVPNWLEKLSAALSGNIGLVGPRSTSTRQWQGQGPATASASIVLPVDRMLAFFCVLMPRAVFEKVGYLDEDFGIGFGDDDHYCARVHRHGYRLAYVPSLTIPHHHRTTFKAMFSPTQISEMHQKAAAMFQQKVKAL